ncbi:class I SAM-dependent DNA methyltransferase [Myxococcus sp. AS-1-15]|uniref:HsdM family class I SAM-dependent methyltransferase n=1 Tax=Myxococcus sp. AS-1-15 TaxID=2874600 RepID=UPI001CBB5B50|nr:N-6 DNA methylase [Myxococcus sp. AS-1-15]MBZ4402408.1 N-6 DNA methylase [Myxococcus sp. AS-1-15]
MQDAWRACSAGNDERDRSRRSHLGSAAGPTHPTSTSLSVAVRRIAANLDPKRTGLSGAKRLDLSLQLLSGRIRDARLAQFHRLISALPAEERDWWIGTLHTLLMPSTERRRLAAHFTPPNLARRVLELAVEAGIDLRTARIIDPCAGGAAFLGTVADELRRSNIDAGNALRRLKGLEIDEHLAVLARAILARRLGRTSVPAHVISVGDALSTGMKETFDAVLANPPYGRMLGVPKEKRMRWAHLADPGHVNLYALFVGLALDLLRPGGIAALILPASFLAGPLFGRLRTHIRTHAKIISVHVLDDRNGVFFDVAQDTCVLLLRKGQSGNALRWGAIAVDGTARPLGNTVLPQDFAAPWPMPLSNLPHSHGLAHLSHWGFEVRAGYFVWNREGHRMSKNRASPLDFPLVWAVNVNAGKKVHPEARDGDGVDFVRFEKPSQAILRQRSVIVQRTTNNRQRRRLVAGPIAASVLARYHGFVTENHTLTLIPTNDGADLELICQLLGSASVDAMYRRIAGTASISVRALRELPLPWPEHLRAALEVGLPFEDAVSKAYTMGTRETHERTPD